MILLKTLNKGDSIKTDKLIIFLGIAVVIAIATVSLIMAIIEKTKGNDKDNRLATVTYKHFEDEIDYIQFCFKGTSKNYSITLSFYTELNSHTLHVQDWVINQTQLMQDDCYFYFHEDIFNPFVFIDDGETKQRMFL